MRYYLLMSDKLELRRILIYRRESLSAIEVRSTSEAVTANALRLPKWSHANRVHIYDSRSSWNELDTNPMVAILQREYPSLQIDTSAVDADTPMPTYAYDIIVVPVLGFDNKGYRLGMGKGWYDRFLAAQPQALTVGIAYSWSKVDRLPNEPHDVPLDYIVTESETFHPIANRSR